MTTGLTVHVRFDEASCHALEAWARTLPVKRVLPAEKLHLTMIRSAQDHEFIALGEFAMPMEIDLAEMRLRLFPVNSGGRALTINFGAPPLKRRANQIRRDLGLPKRKLRPHISVCYGAEGITKRDLQDFRESFPLSRISAIGEYAMAADRDFARNI
jgi:hypothetical protein